MNDFFVKLNKFFDQNLPICLVGFMATLLLLIVVFLVKL